MKTLFFVILFLFEQKKIIIIFFLSNVCDPAKWIADAVIAFVRENIHHNHAMVVERERDISSWDYVKSK